MSDNQSTHQELPHCDPWKSARKVLDRLLRNEQVSRWEVFNHRRVILDITQMEEKYRDLEDKVFWILDSAKESL